MRPAAHRLLAFLPVGFVGCRLLIGNALQLGPLRIDIIETTCAPCAAPSPVPLAAGFWRCDLPAEPQLGRAENGERTPGSQTASVLVIGAAYLYLRQQGQIPTPIKKIVFENNPIARRGPLGA